MFDFLIIGGGIAGLSAGARLSHLGKVCLLEAEAHLGYHASGRSAAMFEETYGSPTTVALNRASKSYLMHHEGGVLSPRGLMLLARNDEREAFDMDCKTMAMDEISFQDAIKFVPILDENKVSFAGYHAAAWDIDTDLLLQNFAREIRANGGVICQERRVGEISKTAKGWRISANGENFECQTIINAAGAWADTIATMAGIDAIGIQPFRRSMARIAAPGGHDLTKWPMMFGTGEAWYAKPDAGMLLVSPADEEPSHPHDAWADDMVLAEGLERYQQMVTEPVTRIQSNWAGLRSFSPDRSLVIGFEPSDPSFFWVAGQGGYGFQSCAGASQLVADLIAGTPSELERSTIAGLDPARFRA